MRIRFILFHLMVSLVFIILYKPEVILPISTTLTEQRAEVPVDTQEEENERQSEEKILLTQAFALLTAGYYRTSYFLKNTGIPITLPFPLHEPPPNGHC